MREEQTIQLTSELQRAEEAYKQNGLLDTVIEEIILVEGELGQGGAFGKICPPPYALRPGGK